MVPQFLFHQINPWDWKSKATRKETNRNIANNQKTLSSRLKDEDE